ncbi:MAG: VWA domain-containing protein [Dehalococcoidia bacterium]
MSLPKLVRTAHGERGQILMLSAMMLVVLLGMVAMVVDVGRFLHERQDIQNVVDAAALAGAYDLPSEVTDAESNAMIYALANDGELDAGDVDITFRCIVGDRNGDGQPDNADIPAVCDPGGQSFTCFDELCVSFCSPATGGTKCNTIYIESDKDVPYIFAPALNVFSGNTGSINAAACKGSCGGAPTGPADVVIILDRTRSMSSDDVENAKDAATAVLEIFNPQFQHVALGVLPPSEFDDDCASIPNSEMDETDTGDWVPVGLSNDYKNADGTLDTSSELVSVIDCLERAPFTFSTHQTNLGTPIDAAVDELVNNGRTGVRKGIIFLTDGEANQPGVDNPCLYAYQEAEAAKTQEIEMFTIGYGISSWSGTVECTDDDDPPYEDEDVTELLADMATESIDDAGNGGCNSSSEIDAENVDGDHFYCEARGEDLDFVFEAAATVLAQGVRLILLPQ